MGLPWSTTAHFAQPTQWKRTVLFHPRAPTSCTGCRIFLRCGARMRGSLHGIVRFTNHTTTQRETLFGSQKYKAWTFLSLEIFWPKAWVVVTLFLPRLATVWRTIHDVRSHGFTNVLQCRWLANCLIHISPYKMASSSLKGRRCHSTL